MTSIVENVTQGLGLVWCSDHDDGRSMCINGGEFLEHLHDSSFSRRTLLSGVKTKRLTGRSKLLTDIDPASDIE
jgi:hypothetical protein